MVWKIFSIFKVHDFTIYGANGGATRTPPSLLAVQRYVCVRYTRARN